MTNGAGYQTASDVTSAISAALAEVTQFDFEVVNSLPASGVKGIIYLIADSHGTNDGYDEYIWINNGFEKLGHTDIDLSGYRLKTDNTFDSIDVDELNVGNSVTTGSARFTNAIYGTSAQLSGTMTVGADPSSSMEVATKKYVDDADAGFVPTSRTINGHALSDDINVTNVDLGNGFGTCNDPTS